MLSSQLLLMHHCTHRFSSVVAGVPYELVLDPGSVHWRDWRRQIVGPSHHERLAGLAHDVHAESVAGPLPVDLGTADALDQGPQTQVRCVGCRKPRL